MGVEKGSGGRGGCGVGKGSRGEGVVGVEGVATCRHDDHGEKVQPQTHVPRG